MRESDNHRWIIRKFDAPPRLLHAREISPGIAQEFERYYGVHG
ncbi:MAG TPA: hypothetical protein VNV39_15910 [Stellaceae bacterium]|nr:hypothetical protein [Stellaceae bacterium]